MGCGNMVLHGESHMKGSQNERFTTELSNEALYQFFNIHFLQRKKDPILYINCT